MKGVVLCFGLDGAVSDRGLPYKGLRLCPAAHFELGGVSRISVKRFKSFVADTAASCKTSDELGARRFSNLISGGQAVRFQGLRLLVDAC